ncbi:adenylate/guanylate cyclase domain-containing protein [Gemmatimonadota bacterium]
MKAEEDFTLRIGIHQGDLVISGGDVFGDGVNIASRIEPLAPPGGICITEKVYSDLRNKPGIWAVPMGEKKLKNVDRPIKLYSLSEEEPPAAVTEPSVDKKTEPAPAKKISRRILIASALIVVAILGLFAIYSRYFAVPATAPSDDEMKSIAVLPFVDMSAGKDQEYFCDGLAEELLNMLAKIKGLRVIARTSSFSFKGKDVDIAAVGEKLNVGTVLEGSVRKADHVVRITAQLINVADESHLWSETYDRKLDDIFVVQEEISRQVVDVLKVTLLGEEDEELARRPTDNIEAYELYLQGNHYLNIWTEASFNNADDYFTQAIELDSSFASAYAHLAATYIHQHRWANLQRDEALCKAEEAVNKALSIDSLCAYAHMALGLIRELQADLSGADAEFKKAIELNPNNMSTYIFYSNVLFDLGRWRDARAMLKHALEIDPLSWSINRQLKSMSIYLGRFGESKDPFHAGYGMYGHLDANLSAMKWAVERDPGNASHYAVLTGIYVDMGEYELAEKLMARAKELAPEKIVIQDEYQEDHLYLAQGQYTRYLQIAYDRVSKDPDRERFLCDAAFAEMLVGNYEKAVTLYERARSAYRWVDPPFGLQPKDIAWDGRAHLIYMAKAYFKTGDPETGEKLLAESWNFLGKLREQGLGTPFSYYFEVSLNALGGNKQEALASLRKAVDLGWRRHWLAKIDPSLELLWDSPEFKEMMAEVERDIAWKRVRGNVFFYSALSIVVLLIAFLIFLNRSTSLFASRYRRSINVSMGVCVALEIFLGIGAVLNIFGLGEIIYWTMINIVFESNVGWPVLGLLFNPLYGMMVLILEGMLLGVGVGMLVAFVRGRCGGGPSE